MLPSRIASLTDDQWTAAKKDFAAEAHAALGMGAMVRKKYDVAESEFKTAIDNGSTSPTRPPWYGWAGPT